MCYQIAEKITNWNKAYLHFDIWEDILNGEANSMLHDIVPPTKKG
jgi:hypothetical protein